MAEQVPLGKLDVLSLSNELTEVVDWHSLGILLGIPPHLLAEIQANHAQNQRRKTETLDLWLRRTPNASWEHVVKALRQMGQNRVAENIAKKLVQVDPILPHVDDSPLASSQTPLVAPHEESVPTGSFVVIERSDLHIGDKLGGEVYKCKWKSRSLTVAVKRLSGELQEGEASKLGSLRHRNIILFHGVVMQAPDYWMVTEYAENGSLFEFLQRNQFNIDLDRSLKWAKEIARGLHYLHCDAPEAIIHGDLKSSNVLLTSEWTVKICDFGSARKYYHTTNKTILGTFPWTAPEVHEKQASISCDIFSYGVVLWELITHQKPFGGFEGVAVAMKIISGERPPIPETCPQYLAHLMRECWQHDPKRRPKSSDILEVLHKQNAAAFSTDTSTTKHTRMPSTERASFSIDTSTTKPTHMPSIERGGQPTMTELLRFQGKERRINIPQEVSTKYTQFGILLLNDSNGGRIRNMEHEYRGNAERINMEILREWISGSGKQPVSWATLAKVLQDVGLSVLARDIEEVKL